MKNFLKEKILIFSLFVFLFSFETALAQTLDLSSLQNSVPASSQINLGDDQTQKIMQAGIDNSLSIEIYPKNPGPNTKTTITINNYLVDLNNAEISWSIDGKPSASGTGVKSFSFTTGKMGEISKISISAKTAEGKTINKDILIRSTQLDLVWQTNSYVPPFYKGKALYSGESLINIVAIPNIIDSQGNMVDPSKFTYKWKKNGSVLGDVSGYGKNSIYLMGNVLGEPIRIEVEATSLLDGGISTKAEINYKPTRPFVLLYQNSPIYGVIYEKALVGESSLAGQEISLVGIPYFFGTQNRNDANLKYSWKMNSKSIEGENGDSIIFRNESNISGSSNISLTVENLSKVIQSASSKFNLKFGIK